MESSNMRLACTECQKEYSPERMIYSCEDCGAPLEIDYGSQLASSNLFKTEGEGVPDKIIVPTGSGGNISAHWKAWKELQSLGYVEELPSMVAVQAEGCCPIVDAFEKGKKKTEHFGETLNSTIASSIAHPHPPKGD